MLPLVLPVSFGQLFILSTETVPIPTLSYLQQIGSMNSLQVSQLERRLIQLYTNPVHYTVPQTLVSIASKEYLGRPNVLPLVGMASHLGFSGNVLLN